MVVSAHNSELVGSGMSPVHNTWVSIISKGVLVSGWIVCGVNMVVEKQSSLSNNLLNIYTQRLMTVLLCVTSTFNPGTYILVGTFLTKDGISTVTIHTKALLAFSRPQLSTLLLPLSHTQKSPQWRVWGHHPTRLWADTRQEVDWGIYTHGQLQVVGWKDTYHIISVWKGHNLSTRISRMSKHLCYGQLPVLSIIPFCTFCHILLKNTTKPPEMSLFWACFRASKTFHLPNASNVHSVHECRSVLDVWRRIKASESTCRMAQYSASEFLCCPYKET